MQVVILYLIARSMSMNIQQCMNSVSQKLEVLDHELDVNQTLIASIIGKIEQQIRDKKFVAENLFVRPIEEDIDNDAWFDMTSEERFEYNEKKYANNPLFDLQHQLETSPEDKLKAYTKVEKGLSAEKNILTHFMEQLIELQDLINNSTYLNGKHFEIQNFNFESVLDKKNIIATSQLDAWINTLKKYPGVTPKFFDTMQFSPFYMYKDNCMKWISDFVIPEDQRAALSIFDRLDNVMDVSAIKTDLNSPFNAVYKTIDDIKKHGDSTGYEPAITLANALKRDLYQLEKESDIEAREQRKTIFLTRLHSMDDLMSQNRNSFVVKQLKALLEVVSFVFEFAWATVTGAPEKPSFFNKRPRKTERRQRVDKVDETFESVERSKNKNKPYDLSSEDDKQSKHLSR